MVTSGLRPGRTDVAFDAGSSEVVDEWYAIAIEGSSIFPPFFLSFLSSLSSPSRALYGQDV